MKQLAKRFLVRLSGNGLVQRWLERGVLVSQYLMGIGSGSEADVSGERVLIAKLKQLAKLKQRATDGGRLCIFDVGANKGQFVRLLAHGLQGVSYHIHAFEPGRGTYKYLCENVGAIPDVTLNNVGLGNQAGEVELFYDNTGSGLASLSKRRVEHLGIDFGRSEKITLDTLDNYCLRHSIKSIDLLKLDVEGHELDVLQGGLKMLDSGKVEMVSFEFGGCNIDSRTYLRDFFYFFREHGFSDLFRITPSGHLVPIDRYQESLEQFGTTNFLAVIGKSPAPAGEKN